MERIAPVVTTKALGEPDGDGARWRQLPPHRRIAMVEELRRRHHGWDDGARPELQRVHRVVTLRGDKRASGRLQDLADLEAPDHDGPT